MRKQLVLSNVWCVTLQALQYLRFRGSNVLRSLVIYMSGDY